MTFKVGRCSTYWWQKFATGPKTDHKKNIHMFSLIYMKLGHYCLFTYEVNIAQKPSHEFSSSVSKYLCGKVFFQLDMYVPKIDLVWSPPVIKFATFHFSWNIWSVLYWSASLFQMSHLSVLRLASVTLQSFIIDALPASCCHGIPKQRGIS